MFGEKGKQDTLLLHGGKTINMRKRLEMLTQLIHLNNFCFSHFQIFKNKEMDLLKLFEMR